MPAARSPRPDFEGRKGSRLPSGHSCGDLDCGKGRSVTQDRRSSAPRRRSRRRRGYRRSNSCFSFTSLIWRAKVSFRVVASRPGDTAGRAVGRHCPYTETSAIERTARAGDRDGRRRGGDPVRYIAILAVRLLWETKKTPNRYVPTLRTGRSPKKDRNILRSRPNDG